jgi:hypothetical protein
MIFMILSERYDAVFLLGQVDNALIVSDFIDE